MQRFVRVAVRVAAIGLAAVAVHGGAHAQGVDPLRHCRSIVDPMTRLACFDATAPADAATRPAAGSSPSTDERAPARPAATTAPADAFGLPERPTVATVDAIRSSVGTDFSGWHSRSRITLENGQVWEVVDGSSGFVDARSRNVVVRRGALGSYRLEFEGLNVAPTVRRVK